MTNNQSQRTERDSGSQNRYRHVKWEICNDFMLFADFVENNGCADYFGKIGMRPVVPPKSNRKKPWEYDKELYNGQNVVEDK